MIMEDQEAWIKFMDINLDFGEVQHTFNFSKQKSTTTLLDSLTLEIKNWNQGTLSISIFFFFLCLYGVLNFLNFSNKFNVGLKSFFN